MGKQADALSASRRTANGPFYRRTPALVAYWRGGRFIVHPYRTGPAYDANPAIIRFLDGLSSWTSLEQFSQAVDVNPGTARTLMDRLVRQGLVERRVREPDKTAPPTTAWDTWGEAAAFLHYSTRDRDFLAQARAKASVARRLREQAPPSPVKEYSGRPRRPLPRVRDGSRFLEVLHARRTWRRFASAPLPLAELSAVLHATFAVQRWADLGALGRVMLRTSPSGGARHPIEAYVFARKVSGLPARPFYYAPDEHALVEVGRDRVTSATITRMLADQSWFGRACAVVVLTAVVERKAWAYRHARAYRSLLLESGHFAQTFCLAATARGLAPFCTGAFREGEIEKTLGLDDREPVLYVTGVGIRPPGVRWAPLPPGEQGLGE